MTALRGNLIPGAADWVLTDTQARRNYIQVAAFGMTRRRGIGPEDDLGLKKLVESVAPVITALISLSRSILIVFSSDGSGMVSRISFASGTFCTYSKLIVLF